MPEWIALEGLASVLPETALPCAPSAAAARPGIDAAARAAIEACSPGSLRAALARAGFDPAGAQPGKVDLLMFAAGRGAAWAIPDLLRVMDPMAVDVRGRSALSRAASRCDLESIALLAPVSDAPCPDSEGATPLARACAHCRGEPPEDLMRAAGLAADKSGVDPLMRAARCGSDDAPAWVDRLLALGGGELALRADVDGNTALSWAAREGHARIAESLMAAGADPRARGPGGATPLILAARKGKGGERMIRALLPGSDLLARDGEGQTALMRAARWGRCHVAPLLAGEGAAELLSPEGEDALAIARRWRAPAQAALFEAALLGALLPEPSPARPARRI